MEFRAAFAALLALPLLAGCEALGPDALASQATGRRCSAVNLRDGLSWCRPLEAPPQPQPVCTRSRGSVDCWRTLPEASPPYRGIADGPATLTPEQEAARLHPGARF